MPTSTAKKVAPAKDFDRPEFTRIDARCNKIVQDQSAVKDMFKEIADMYWISEDSDVHINKSGWDKSDIRYTKSPNSRNEVTGLHRMLRTSKPQFKVTCQSKEIASRIEEALSTWWKASSERKRATVQSDLSLMAALFSDTNLSVTAIDDLLKVKTLPPARRRRLEALRSRTLFLFEADSALDVYPVWGEDGLSEHLIEQAITGRQLKERWGAEGKEDDQEYTLRDYHDLSIRCVYVKGEHQPLEMGAYDLPDMPRFSAVADGTEIFHEEIRKRQPFLYAKWKSGLHKREDETLTVTFTSAYSRGAGPLVLIDPTSVSADGKPVSSIKVQYAGVLRYILAKGTFANDQAYDANLIQLFNLLSGLGQASTINEQTLGENIEPGTTYSGYAMASQNGRIPVIPIQEALEKVTRDGCIYALRYFKQAGMEWRDLKASQIPDDLDIEVKYEVDLPQDAGREAQTVANLRNADVPISDEWIHDFLHIKDSKKMAFDVMTEKATKAAFEQDLPQLLQEMSAMFQKTPPSQTPVPSQTPPEIPPNAPPTGEGPVMPGGPAQMQAGGEAIPGSEPLPVEQVNNGRA